MYEVVENGNQERRATPRARALKKGVIAYKDRYCSAECMIKNESDTGALLVVSQNQVIPNIFELKVYPGGDYRAVEVIWRTPDALGIRYVDQGVTAPMAPTGAPNAHSAWDGVERRAPQNRRKSDRRG